MAGLHNILNALSRRHRQHDLLDLLVIIGSDSYVARVQLPAPCPRLQPGQAAPCLPHLSHSLEEAAEQTGAAFTEPEGSAGARQGTQCRPPKECRRPQACAGSRYQNPAQPLHPAQAGVHRPQSKQTARASQGTSLAGGRQHPQGCVGCQQQSRAGAAAAPHPAQAAVHRGCAAGRGAAAG